MTDLVWEKDGFEDWKARTPFGDYSCIRTLNDTSALWFRGEKLGTYGGGSHAEAKAAAEDHYQTVMKDNDPMRDASVEAVARAFCKRMGLDPDEGGCLLPGNPSFDVAYYGPRWQQVAQDAREAIAMHLALKEAQP